MIREFNLSKCVFCLCVALSSIEARAQGIEAEAYVGEPFGVGAVMIPSTAGILPEPLGAEGLGLSEKNGRVFYPAMRNPAIAGLLKDFLNEDSPLTSGGPVRAQVGGILRGVLNRPPRSTIYFLFRGTAPLELSLEGRQSIVMTVQPRESTVASRRLLQAWWKDYTAPRRLLQQKPDYPPLIETYLIDTLSRRLGLQLPREKQETSGYTQFEQEVGAMIGSESIRTGLEQDRILGTTNLNQAADRPLPPPVELPPLAFPEPAGEVKIETMAMRVPAEFFYIRFGNYDNFLWFQDTLETWGGDLQNLAAMRGLNDGRSRRIQQQLVIKQTELSRMLGNSVTSDVAMVGTDMLFEDGPAIGFIFETRSNLLFGSSISGPRADRIKAGGVTESTVKIEGQDVSYLSSPDGSVRSYYVISGNYHFVTSSRFMAARFLQTIKEKDGHGSLGATADFRRARSIMPGSRGDAVFIYFSDAFFRNFTGPHQRIEMMRRLEASTDIQVLQLAKLNAATEGQPGSTIAELLAAGMLPPGFGPRPDGSQAVLGNGEVIDSLRGRRGSFIPVADMPVDHVSQAEQDSYSRFANYYVENWGRQEPLMVGIQRKSLPDKRERVTLDARMTPLSRKKVEFFEKWAGPADKQHFAPVPGDMAAFEAVLKGQRLLGGLRDSLPPSDIIDGRILSMLKLRMNIAGYLGSLGDPGILGILNATFLQPPDANGFARSVIGLWRLLYGPYTLYSFQSDVLTAVAPQLHLEPSEYLAQLRLHVNDVTEAHITPFLNNWGYSRTRETELGNLRLMHSLHEQLHVPPADCKEAAEFLLAAKMVCPLGGEYVLREVPGGISRWTSTRLEETAGQDPKISPAGYVAPPLSWFRGLDLHAALVDDVLSAHGEVIMQLPNGEKK